MLAVQLGRTHKCDWDEDFASEEANCTPIMISSTVLSSYFLDIGEMRLSWLMHDNVEEVGFAVDSYIFVGSKKLGYRNPLGHKIIVSNQHQLSGIE